MVETYVVVVRVGDGESLREALRAAAEIVVEPFAADVGAVRVIAALAAEGAAEAEPAVELPNLGRTQPVRRRTSTTSTSKKIAS